MLVGVTRHMLPHLPGVPHLHVNRPLNTMIDQGKIINTYALLTKLIQSRWLDIGQVRVCAFIDRDEVVVNKSAKRSEAISSHLD